MDCVHPATGRRKSAAEWGKMVSLCDILLIFLMLLLVLMKIVAPRTFLQQNWNIIITMVLFYLPNAFAFKLDRKSVE